MVVDMEGRISLDLAREMLSIAYQMNMEEWAVSGRKERVEEDGIRGTPFI